MSTITITVIKHTNTMIKLMNTMIKLTPEDIGGNEPLERFPLQLDGLGGNHHAAQSKEHLQAGHFAVRDTLGRRYLAGGDIMGSKLLHYIDLLMS